MAIRLSENLANGTIVVHATCCECGKEYNFEVPRDAALAWSNGARIQDAMPMLSPNERELLISGICETCFDKIFGV